MSSTLQPSQGPTGGGSSQHSNRGGRHRGGSGRGGSGNKASQPTAASPGTPLPPGTRFSALGNPLPPLKDESSAKKENPPTVLGSEPKVEPQMSPRISAPPNVSRNVSTGSSATTQSDRSRGEARDRRRNSNRSGGGSAAVSDHPPRAAAPQWPNVSNRTPQVNSATKASTRGASDANKSDFPEVLNAAEWGDDEEHVTQEIIEERLRTQLERVRNEKLALQKTIGDLQSDLEKVKTEMSKHKTEADQLRTESDKATTIQKSYAALRQTRDTLEAERDALKKSLFIAEKDLTSLKEDSNISITKLTMEVDALKATVEYQELQLDAIKSSSVPAAPGVSNVEATTWVYASLVGSNSDRIADALSFSSLELCRLNASSWSMNDDAGFRQSLSKMVFERAGEELNPNSPNFAQDAREACARMVASADVLVIVPRKPEALSPSKFDEYLVRIVQLFSDAREMVRSSKQLAVVLEDFSQNRIVVGNGKVVPVNLIIA